MNAARTVQGLALGLIALAVAACGTTAPARFYTLDATATATGAPLAHGAVLVEPVTIPAAVDQPEFVVRIADNRVGVDEFNRWVAPLGDGIARAVAGDLTVLLGSANVAVAPLANFAPDYQVSINVQRFESRPGDAALLDAVWTVRQTASGATRSGRTVARQAVVGQDYAALAAAHSRALAVMSGDIAAAIRAEAEMRP